MRRRINRNAVASSYNYTSSRKAHIAMLEENHERNSAFFMSITVEHKEKTGNELFLDKLKESYAEYKRRKAIEEIEFKAKLKAFLNH